MNTTIQPPERITDPAACQCYSTSTDGIVYPVLCSQHRADYEKLVGFMTCKYSRYFLTEQDARDRQRIIQDRWPAEGYGTWINIDRVSRWWLVRAWWSDSCE